MFLKRINWQTVAIGVFGLLSSFVLWQANSALGRLEAAEAEVSSLKASDAVKNEALLNFRADQKETLERVKRIEEYLLRSK
jgi:hypothetical protein